MSLAADVTSVADMTVVEDRTGADVTVTSDLLHHARSICTLYLRGDKTFHSHTFHSQGHV